MHLTCLPTIETCSVTKCKILFGTGWLDVIIIFLGVELGLPNRREREEKKTRHHDFYLGDVGDARGRLAFLLFFLGFLWYSLRLGEMELRKSTCLVRSSSSGLFPQCTLR